MGWGNGQQQAGLSLAGPGCTVLWSLVSPGDTGGASQGAWRKGLCVRQLPPLNNPASVESFSSLWAEALDIPLVFSISHWKDSGFHGL